jgi:diguanylate cyclase (GGDEF)-like protein
LGSGRPVSLIVLDVEGMTTLNETYGTVVGDQVLRELAQRVRTSARPADVVGRLGGDTFVVLAPGVDSADARGAMDDLHHWVATEPVDVRGHEICVEVSVGCATLGPTTRSYRLLLEAAQRELNEARRARITSTLDTKS